MKTITRVISKPIVNFPDGWDEGLSNPLKKLIEDGLAEELRLPTLRVAGVTSPTFEFIGKSPKEMAKVIYGISKELGFDIWIWAKPIPYRDYRHSYGDGEDAQEFDLFVNNEREMAVGFARRKGEAYNSYQYVIYLQDLQHLLNEGVIRYRLEIE